MLEKEAGHRVGDVPGLGRGAGGVKERRRRRYSKH